MARVSDLRVEHLSDALGIETRRPRLSWRLESAPGEHGPAEQLAYEVEVVRDDAVTSRTRVASGDQHLVPWPERELNSRERVRVRVRTEMSDGARSPWSSPLAIEVGLGRDDWHEDFVSPSVQAPATGPRPAHWMRAPFTVPVTAMRIRAYVAVHGVYELELNGSRTDDAELAPGWSSFGHRLRYQTYDLDELALVGNNVLGIWLADGWYRGRLGFNGGLWDVYGSDVAALVQVEVLHTDGRLERIPLSWRTAQSPITATGLYEGETYDARLELDRWSQPGFDDAAWSAPVVLPRAQFAHELQSPTGPPVRVIESLRPVATEVRGGGRLRLDFGQNISGKVRFTASATAGHVLRLHHAEVLENDELCVRPLRTATSVDTYIFSGQGRETFTPRFTIHGFRYVEIENWPQGQAPGEIEALVVHSDMRRTGWFESSHELLDSFHENVVWSMRDNFVDLPTDCPQRDERLGWTGDIQVFAPAATFLYDSTGVILTWLRDLMVEQREHGTVRNFHPWLECGFPAEPAAGWGDAAVLVPWTLYQRTGDLTILGDHVESMAAWVDQVEALTGGTGLWDRGFQLGDWLDPAAAPERPGDSATDAYLVATAYHARTAGVLAQTCRILGDEARATRYGEIEDRARLAFRSHFVTPAGRVVSDTVAALSLAICFDLLDGQEQLDVAGRRLAERVREGDHLIRTGFIGTPLVCDALVRTGSIDTAYHLLLQTRCPSWLYPVTMGATTVWERWDSMLADGSVNPGEMTSFNHYALGAVVDFMHRTVAGLTPTAPGYSEVLLAPRPGGGLTHASASHLSPHGLITSSWRRDGTTFVLVVDVPPGVRATVQLPGQATEIDVPSGRSEHRCTWRAAADDQPMPRLWNVHNPQDRAEMTEAGVL